MKNYTATRNACKLCTPLGAALAFRGVAGCLCILHGSQGCATYIRRYMISHFKEPVDIASSSFTEDTAIFGGASNLKLAIDNVICQYNPDIIGIASTCLSETIGDDTEMIVREYIEECGKKVLPHIVRVSTPSYRGTHIDGYYGTIKAIVGQMADRTEKEAILNLFPGMLSPVDIRYLKEILVDFGIDYKLLPDYSESLEGGLWNNYMPIPPGGTEIKDIISTGNASLSIEMGIVHPDSLSAAALLDTSFDIPYERLPIPIGINTSDNFFNILSDFSGNKIPEKHKKERERLVDSYADGHKYVFGIRALVYGEEDLVLSLSSFLCEIGIIPAIIASGGQSGTLKDALRKIIPWNILDQAMILEGVDFEKIKEITSSNQIDLIIGNSKGYKMSKALSIPMIRVGFPVHDRFGAQRIMHVGYRGTQSLFDRIVNIIIAKRQESSAVGYSYI